MTDSDNLLREAGSAADCRDDNTPEQFNRAVEAMHGANLREEITLGTIRPPQRLAPYSHAVGLEVAQPVPEDLSLPVHSDGDAFGRLILLHDPAADEAWDGQMRMVAYIQADVDHVMAEDQLMPEVAWDWLKEALETNGAGFTNLGGTVTATSSMRFGEIGGPPRAYQLELRASWTATGLDLDHHVEAFAEVLAHAAGLPEEGTASIATAG